MADKKPLPIIRDTYQRTSGIEAPDVQPQYSAFEAMGATIMDIAYDNFTPAAARFGQYLLQGVDNSSPILSKEQLQERYPDLKDIFTHSMRENQARTIAERQRFRNVLKDVANNGPDTVGMAAARIGVGLLTGFVDPLALATGVGVAQGIARAGKSVPAISRILGPGAQATARGRMGIAAAEGFAGAAIEQPVVLAAASLDKSEYGFSDAMLNLTVAPVFGAAISGSASLLRRAFGGPASIRKEQMMLLRAQEDAGVKQNISHLDDFEVSRVSNPDFQYKKFDPAIEYNHKTFYIPATKAGPTMNEGTMARIFDDFGEGVYMTDDLVVANRHSHAGEMDSNGGIYEARFREQPTVLDLDTKPVSDDLQLLVEAGVKSPETKTIKQSLQELADTAPDKLDEIKEKLSERYDVAMHSGGESNGRKYSNANVLMVLRPDKLDVKYKGSTDLASIPSFKDVDQVSAKSIVDGEPELYDEDAFSSFDRRMQEPIAEPKLVEMDKELELRMEELEELAEMGYVTKQELDSLRADPLLKEMDTDKQVFKFLYDCMG